MTQYQEEDVIVQWDSSDTYESYEDYVARTKRDSPEEVREDPWVLSEKAWISDQEDESYVNYQDMLGEVQKAMDTFEDNYWHVEGTNLGWMHRSGYNTFRAETAVDFLHAILSKTSIDDCIFTLWWLYNDERKVIGMAMVNSHHDAMGEQYTIRPATEEEIEDIEER